MSETRQWSTLDNAAKIFPPTSSRRDTKVFRVTCELNEHVDPAILQNALDKTMLQFPLYSSVLKKGLFWYYLEQSGLKAKVKEEYRYPCSPLYYEDKKSLLFEVTYYKKGINVEVYHALSDGAGAIHFLRTLVFYYIKEKYREQISHDLTFDYDATSAERGLDSFAKYYNGESVKLKSDLKKSFHIRGERFPSYKLGLIEGRMSANSVLKAAKANGLTLTEFLTAVLIHSIHEIMTLRDEKRPVSISIPVNLRSFFPTESARNFFSTMTISHDFKTQGSSLEEIMAATKLSFQERLTKEKISAKMNGLYAWQDSFVAKLVPLMIKIYVLKIINWFADKEVTATMSNLGRLSMPEETMGFIKRFDSFISTKRLHICLTTFNDVLAISFTSSFMLSDVQKHFFRTLIAYGVDDIEIISNITEAAEPMEETVNAL